MKIIFIKKFFEFFDDEDLKARHEIEYLTGEIKNFAKTVDVNFKDETIATWGLKYFAEDTGTKSTYQFAIKTLDDKFIGTLGVDFTKRKTKLDMESINHLMVHASSLGGVLMTHLQN